MAEEEKQIELPVEPIEVEESTVGEPGIKKRTNIGVIWFSIITGIACLIIVYYLFKKEKFNNSNRGGSNSGGGLNNRSKLPILNSRTISSNSGYGGTFNGTGRIYSTKTL
jgi:hypothetical protein